LEEKAVEQNRSDSKEEESLIARHSHKMQRKIEGSRGSRSTAESTYFFLLNFKTIFF